MERFVNRDLVALFGKVARAGQTGGTAAYDSHLVTVALRTDGLSVVDYMIICDKAFKPTYCHGLAFNSPCAIFFALIFLRTDSAADGGKVACLCDNLISLLELPVFDFGNKIRYIVVDGTALYARTRLAVKTPHGFLLCLLGVVAEIYFIEIFYSLGNVLTRHRRLFFRHIEIHLFSLNRLQACARSVP